MIYVILDCPLLRIKNKSSVLLPTPNPIKHGIKISIIKLLTTFLNEVAIIIPIATSIATWSAVLIYVILLIKFKYFNTKHLFFYNIVKILVSSLTMSLGLYYLLSFFEDKLIYSNYYKSFYLIMIIILATSAYLLIARLLGVFKIKNFKTN